MKHEKSCGCIVMNDNEEVLLVLHNAGHWGLPKGHMEEGETEVQTAIREVKEETNIDVTVNEKFRYTMEYSPKDDVWKEVVYFLAHNVNNQGEAQLEEVSQVKWFELNKAIEKITYDNSKELLRKFKEDLKKKEK